MIYVTNNDAGRVPLAQVEEDYVHGSWEAWAEKYGVGLMSELRRCQVMLDMTASLLAEVTPGN